MHLISRGMDKPNQENKLHFVFCKHYDVKDLQGDITFQICSAVNKIVKWQALGAQKLRGIWIIGLKTESAKTTLLQSTLSIANHEIKLYGENPLVGGTGGDNVYQRIVFKDLPLWEPNSLISEYIKTMPQLTATSDDVYFSKARNDTRGSSSFMNGDRYIFIKGNDDPQLPDKIKIGDYTCRIWYSSRKLTCKRCGGNHKTDDTTKCNSYVDPSPNSIYTFSYGPFSNFHKSEVKMENMVFPSSEHAYQFRACEEHLRDDLAEKVFKARTPRDAKDIATEIKSNDPESPWNQKKYNVMREVLIAKINSNVTFKNLLLASHDRMIAEASETDLYWGTGLPYKISITTKPEMYPGKNMLGKLLVELRSKYRNDPTYNDNIDTITQKEVPEPSANVSSNVPSTTLSKPKVRVSRKVNIKHKSIGVKSSTRKTTPLIRNMFKLNSKNVPDSKRKREQSPDHPVVCCDGDSEYSSCADDYETESEEIHDNI